MTDNFKTLSSLIRLVREMEHSLGLDKLTDAEKRVLLAMKELEAMHSEHAVSEIWDHPFTVELSRASLFRSLKTLEKRSLLTSRGGERYRTYRLANSKR